jgi:hypothetical protein
MTTKTTTPNPIPQHHISLAHFAARAYKKSSFVVGETECLADIVNGEWWLALRGTEMSGLREESFYQRMKSRIVDLVNDIRAIPRRTMIGRVHRGFYTGLGGGALGIYQLIVSCCDPVIPIRVTGHSKGAAEARLLAALLASTGYTVLSLVDFGSPRAVVGRCKGLDKIAEVVAYRHGSDLVTALPRGWLWRYAHPHEVDQGTHIQLGDDYSPRRLSVSKYHDIDLYIKAMEGSIGVVS